MIAIPPYQVQKCHEAARKVDQKSDDETSNGSSLPTAEVQDHDVHEKTISFQTPGRRQIFYCSIMPCDYRTDRKNNLKRHIAAMHRASPRAFKCCEQSFSCKAEFRRHTRQVHRDSGYKCDRCGLRFDRRALLLRHTSVHSGVKPFTCSSCGYATSHKSNLLRHCAKRGHTSEPNDYSRSRSSSHGDDYSSDTSSKHSQDSSPHPQLTSPSYSEGDPPLVSSTTEEPTEHLRYTSTLVRPRPLMPSLVFQFPPTSSSSHPYTTNDLYRSHNSYPKAKQAWANAYYMQLQENGHAPANDVPYQVQQLPPTVIHYTNDELTPTNVDQMNNNNHNWILPQCHQTQSHHSGVSENGKVTLPLRVPALGANSLDKCEQCRQNSGMFPSLAEALPSNINYEQKHSLAVPGFENKVIDYLNGYVSQPLIPHPHVNGTTSPNSSYAIGGPKYEIQSADLQPIGQSSFKDDANGLGAIVTSQYQLCQNQSRFHHPLSFPTQQRNDYSFVANSNHTSSLFNKCKFPSQFNTDECNSCKSRSIPFQPWNHPVSTIPTFNGHSLTNVIPCEQSHEFDGTQNGSSNGSRFMDSNRNDEEEGMAFQPKDVKLCPNEPMFKMPSPVTNDKTETTSVGKSMSLPSTSCKPSNSSNDNLSVVPVKKEIWRPVKLRICDNPYKCFECSLSFTRQADYVEHERNHPHQKKVMMSIVKVMNNVTLDQVKKIPNFT